MNTRRARTSRKCSLRTERTRRWTKMAYTRSSAKPLEDVPRNADPVLQLGNGQENADWSGRGPSDKVARSHPEAGQKTVSTGPEGRVTSSPQLQAEMEN